MEVIVRNFYISATDLEEYGFSSGCQGCLSILRGKTRQAHSVACRKTFEGIMTDSETVMRANMKITEFLVRQLEKVDEAKDVGTRAGITDELVRCQVGLAATSSGLTTAERRRPIEEREVGQEPEGPEIKKKRVTNEMDVMELHAEDREEAMVGLARC